MGNLPGRKVDEVAETGSGTYAACFALSDLSFVFPEMKIIPVKAGILLFTFP